MIKPINIDIVYHDYDSSFGSPIAFKYTNFKINLETQKPERTRNYIMVENDSTLK